MPRLTIVFGVVLIALGVGGYLAVGPAAKTALIAAAFGVVFAGLGVAALKEGWRKHAMHAAAALALISLLGPAIRLPLALLRGKEWALPQTIQAVMLVVTAAYLAASINSFIQARRARRAAEAA